RSRRVIPKGKTTRKRDRSRLRSSAYLVKGGFSVIGGGRVRGARGWEPGSRGSLLDPSRRRPQVGTPHTPVVVFSPPVFPQCLLLGGIRLDARGADLGIGDVAVAEVRHGGHGAHDRGRIEELRQVDVRHRKTRRLIMDERRQVLADLRMKRRVLDQLYIEIDAD